MNYLLRITLMSDTTFGRGDGVAGLVDEEVEYDVRTGLPFIRGKTLKGLLVESCADILYALQQSGSKHFSTFQNAARRLYGEGGSQSSNQARMRIGRAEVGEAIRKEVASHLNIGALTPVEVLESVTAVRRQTAMDDTTDSPASGSLRGSRVVLRETTFYAPLAFYSDATGQPAPKPDELALLAACAASTRRAGSGRNRGRGHIRVELVDGADKPFGLAAFISMVEGQ